MARQREYRLMDCLEFRIAMLLHFPSLIPASAMIKPTPTSRNLMLKTPELDIASLNRVELDRLLTSEHAAASGP